MEAAKNKGGFAGYSTGQLFSSSNDDLGKFLQSDHETLSKTMASLNRSFIKKCAEQYTEGSNCSLVPLAMNYISHTLQVLLSHEEEHPSDKSLFSFMDDIQCSVNTLSEEMKSSRRKHNLLHNVEASKRKPAATHASRLALLLGNNSSKPLISGPNKTSAFLASSSSEYFGKEMSQKPALSHGSMFKGIQLPPTSITGNTSTSFLVLPPPISTSTPFPSKLTQGSGGIQLPSFPSNPAAPAFGIGMFKSAVAASSVPTPTNNNNETNDDADETDEPPVNIFTPVAETEVVYETRVKVFEKAEKQFKELGLGTLFVKKLGNGHQLLVRAENNLGTVLINMVLNEQIPVSTKNNHVVTVDPAGNNRKGTTFLIRVKTPADAEMLRTKLDEYKQKGSLNKNA